MGMELAMTTIGGGEVIHARGPRKQRGKGPHGRRS